jgi:hypothetical protein
MRAPEARPLLQVTVDSDDESDGAASAMYRGRALRRTACISAAFAGLVILAAFGFLFAHDEERRARALGTGSWEEWFMSTERHVKSASGRDASSKIVQLGHAGVLSPTATLIDRLRMVPGTENERRGDKETIEVKRSFDGRVMRAPKFLKKWATAPFWESNSYVNIHETPNSEDGVVIVTGHATDISKHASHWLASATHWGLPARLSGHGTTWRNWEEKTMGLKTNLLHMNGDPVVVTSDTGDVFFTCGQEELLKRFEASGADIIASGETQLYPEIKKYFNMREHTDWQNVKNNIGKIGKVKEAALGAELARPYRWANAGLLMGRKSALLRYIDFVEKSFFENDGLSQTDTRFRYACTPFNHTKEEARDLDIAAKFYDDQLCLNAYAMNRAAARDKSFKIDSDGGILHSPGGIDLRNMLRDPVTGRVYNKDTGKAPCVWHFNNPEAKKKLKLVVKRFPNYFVSEAVGAEIVNSAGPSSS